MGNTKMPAQSESKKDKRSVLGVALSYKATPTKEELATILFFFKQLVSVVIGVALGGFKFTGFLGMVVWGVAVNLIAYVYSNVWLEFDEDEMDLSIVYTEAFGPAFGSFMLSWILSNTYLQF